MFQALGYEGASASAAEWLSNISPIVLFLGGVALMLTLAGLGLLLIAARAKAGSSAASGLDKKLR